jgi:hypothetical protein
VKTTSTGRASVTGVVRATVLTACGRSHRVDPVAPRTGGPAGNARLTAWTGLILLVLSIAELFTLLDVGALVSWHIVIGALLIPPALLKTASTGWRVAQYYRGDEGYHAAGPPPLLLRILGPGVVAATLGLLASGVTLILLGPRSTRTVLLTAAGRRVDWLTLHQGLFLVWAVLTGLHVLARTLPAIQLTVRHRPAAPRVDGGGRRAVLIAAVAVSAAVAALLLLLASGSWRSDRGRADHRLPGFPARAGISAHH